MPPMAPYTRGIFHHFLSTCAVEDGKQQGLLGFGVILGKREERFFWRDGVGLHHKRVLLPSMDRGGVEKPEAGQKEDGQA